MYYVSPEELQRIKDEKQRKIQEEADAKAQKLKEEQKIKFLNFEKRAKELAEEPIKRKEAEDRDRELKRAKDVRVAENMARIKEQNKPLNRFKRKAVKETKDYFAILGLFAVGTIIVIIFNFIF